MNKLAPKGAEDALRATLIQRMAHRIPILRSRDLGVEEFHAMQLPLADMLDAAIAALSLPSAEPPKADERALVNLRGVIGSILYIASDERRGWNDWNRVAEICRAALAAAEGKPD